MLWFQGVETPRTSEYAEQSFKTKTECLDWVFWNKSAMVEDLYKVHGKDEKGNVIKTWTFFCENRFIELEAV